MPDKSLVLLDENRDDLGLILERDNIKSPGGLTTVSHHKILSSQNPFDQSSSIGKSRVKRKISKQSLNSIERPQWGKNIYKPPEIEKS